MNPQIVKVTVNPLAEAVTFVAGIMWGLCVALTMLALVTVMNGCAAPVDSAQMSERPATMQEALPIVHTCSARSSLQVGAYSHQWLNWSLTVDSSNFAYLVATTDSGVTVEAKGGMPLAFELPGDGVTFTVAEADGRGGLTQPYPGLAKGYTVEVVCQ